MKIIYQTKILKIKKGDLFKPPIFWKEKDIVKQQINVLSYQKIQDLLTKTNNIELLVKKNPSISINLVNNFILEQCDEANNSI